MSCGAPVICSNRTSLPEVVGDAAISLNPGDTGAMVDAMYGILTNQSLRADLCVRSLQRASQFNWRKTASETIAVYEEVFRSLSAVVLPASICSLYLQPVASDLVFTALHIKVWPAQEYQRTMKKCLPIGNIFPYIRNVLPFLFTYLQLFQLLCNHSFSHLYIVPCILRKDFVCNLTI